MLEACAPTPLPMQVSRSGILRSPSMLATRILFIPWRAGQALDAIAEGSASASRMPATMTPARDARIIDSAFLGAPRRHPLLTLLSISRSTLDSQLLCRPAMPRFSNNINAKKSAEQGPYDAETSRKLTQYLAGVRSHGAASAAADERRTRSDDVAAAGGTSGDGRSATVTPTNDTGEQGHARANRPSTPHSVEKSPGGPPDISGDARHGIQQPTPNRSDLGRTSSTSSDASLCSGIDLHALAEGLGLPPPSADSNVAAPTGLASTPACGGFGAPPDDVAAEEAGAKAAAAECAKHPMTRRRNGVEYVPSDRGRGALVALSRTGEGYQLPSGTFLTCLPDATYNGIMALAPSIAPSRQRMVALAVPELGNVRQASWASMRAALGTLNYSVALEEATARFKAPGGPMVNMLRTKRAVFVVGLHVRIDGVKSEHCVMLSTVPEPHAPFGKLIDNHRKARPVYIEAKDRGSGPYAVRAFRKLVMQNPAARNCSDVRVEVSDVYELVRIDGSPETHAKRPADEATLGDAKRARVDDTRLCAACERTLPTDAFTKSQRKKGSDARCRDCTP